MCEKCGFSGCKHDTNHWEEDAEAFCAGQAASYFDRVYGPETTGDGAKALEEYRRSRRMFIEGALFWRRYRKNPIKAME